MTVYDGQILVVTGGERPSHGYQIGQLLFDTVDLELYRLVARNTHKWMPVRGSLQMKTGKCEFNGTTLRGEGYLQDLAALGPSQVFGAMDGNGTSIGFQTGTSLAQNAGIGTLRTITNDFNGFTRNSFLPYYVFKVTINGRTSGDERFYTGYVRNNTGPAVADDPFTNAVGGIMFGFDSDDTEWSIWHSNADGVTAVSKDVFTPSITIPSSSTNYRVEMIFTTATNIICNVYNSSYNILGTATINTNVLASGRSMNFYTVCQNATTSTQKTLTFYGGNMRAIL